MVISIFITFYLLLSSQTIILMIKPSMRRKQCQKILFSKHCLPQNNLLSSRPCAKSCVLKVLEKVVFARRRELFFSFPSICPLLHFPHGAIFITTAISIILFVIVGHFWSLFLANFVFSAKVAKFYVRIVLSIRVIACMRKGTPNLMCWNTGSIIYLSERE